MSIEISASGLEKLAGIEVPDRAEYVVESDESATLTLEFGSIDGRRLDLLMRKFSQLTETLSVFEPRTMKKQVSG